MIKFDLNFGNTALRALDYTDVTTTSSGDTIDLSGRRGALFILDSHTLAGGTFTFKLQESDDGSNWTDVADADVSTSTNAVAFLAASEDDTTKQIGYHGLQRYVKCVCTATSPSSTNFLSASVIVAENYAD